MASFAQLGRILHIEASRTGGPESIRGEGMKGERSGPLLGFCASNRSFAMRWKARDFKLLLLSSRDPFTLGEIRVQLRGRRFSRERFYLHEYRSEIPVDFARGEDLMPD